MTALVFIILFYFFKPVFVNFGLDDKVRFFIAIGVGMVAETVLFALTGTSVYGIVVNWKLLACYATRRSSLFVDIPNSSFRHHLCSFSKSFFDDVRGDGRLYHAFNNGNLFRFNQCERLDRSNLYFFSGKKAWMTWDLAKTPTALLEIADPDVPGGR